MAKQEYIEKNKAWLADKAKEPGVIALDKGVLYKVIRSGKGGPTPNRNSVVTAHYVGKPLMARLSTAAVAGWHLLFVCAI